MGKRCTDKGELILCTVDELTEDMVYNDDDLDMTDIIGSDDKIDNASHS